MAGEGFLKNRLLPLYLCLFAVPVGIALQTALAIAAMLLMVYHMRLAAVPGTARPAISLKNDHVIHITVIACLFIIWNVVATLLNPANPTSKWMVFPFGYLSFMFLPLLLAKSYGAMTNETLERVESLFAAICVVWALITLSQQFVGWRVLGYQLVYDQDRPHGLFSHPLTLAYSAFAFWPLAMWRVIHHPRRLAPWITAAAISMLIYLSMSRTVQFVAIGSLLLAIGTKLRGRSLVAALALAVLIGGAVALTPNTISQRFAATFSQQGVDRYSNYPDDRLAFWHVHWLMVKERPLLGHGVDLDLHYRNPYYARIGMEDMPKKYEAHNEFLQVAAEGGIIGLLFFLAWWGYLAYIATFRLPKGELRTIVLWTIIAFALASITQNSFQDGDVRMAISLLFGGALAAISCCRQAPHF